MHEHVSHHFFGGGTILTTGTNLGNGQNRSQIAGSDPQCKHLRYVTQGTHESRKKVECGCFFILYANHCFVLQN